MSAPLTSFPLFKGATRTPTFWGVPLMALLFMVMTVGSIVMVTQIYYIWLIAPVAYVFMALITKHDDKAFRIYGLWFETTFRNRVKTFWGGSTYSPVTYKWSRYYDKKSREDA